MNKLTRVLALASVLFTSSSAFAADLVIKNARMFDGITGETINDVTISVAEGRVRSISRGPVKVSGAEVIDADGRTVMPGLINAHLHQYFDFFNTPRFVAGSDEEADEFRKRRVVRLLEGHLQRGFTTVFSPIDFWPQISQLREDIETGKINGPRLLIAGGILVHSGGHYACRGLAAQKRTWCDRNIGKVIDSPASAREAVRFYAQGKVDAIMYDALTNAPGFQPDVVRAMTEEAGKFGLKVMVHNADATDATDLVGAGVDGFVHVPGQTTDHDGTLLAGVGNRHIPVVMPIAVGSQEVARTNAKALLRSGAIPVFASDLPGIAPEQVVEMELRTLGELGLTNEQILLSATRYAAENLLGRTDIGMIAVGKTADLIIIDGDPLARIEDLTRIVTVIKSGKIVN